MPTVIITGAAGGLGQETVSFFLGKGYHVIAIVRGQQDRLPAHERLEVESLDLRDEKAVADFVSRTTARTTVQAALLLAGGFAPGALENTGMEDIRRQIAINFETAYPLARLLFSHFLQQDYGRLILVGSRPALQPAAGKDLIAYTLSKSLLSELAALLNAEAGGKNVTASVIVPSTIDTPVNRKSMPDADFGKWVSPGQIAAAMHFICSESGAPLRGAVLKLYGES
ncbi:SDR family NAD(P)-dependent oxidoreductase [Compostibacter hankyongensis]|uniref:SDR family NAD(P)-dependent oxidoreductase n=1 Tax=Compostibacter hankyongensis TaxID=1007089 RepID=A0ABP8FDB1_9BACT